MTELTDNQHQLLQDAGTSPQGAVDAPSNRQIYAKLIKDGLMIAMPHAGGGSQLLITAAGRVAVGLEEIVAPVTEAGRAPLAEPQDGVAQAPTPLQEEPAAAAAKGKIAVLVALMRRPLGVGLAEACSATGWQAHSVRGAVAGTIKKKLGLAVVSAKLEGNRTYRIDAPVVG